MREPENPATPSAFADWVFHRMNPRWQHRFDDGQDYERRAGELAHQTIDFMIRKGRLQEFMAGDPSRNWEIIYRDDGTTATKPLRASSLRVGGAPLSCKPDLVLRHLALGTIVILERKTNWRFASYLPKSLDDLWDNVRCQLWCYGWIDDWRDAPEVRLAVQFWTRHGRGLYSLAGDPFWWIHGHQPDLEARCREFFEDYARRLERQIA